LARLASGHDEARTLQTVNQQLAVVPIKQLAVRRRPVAHRKDLNPDVRLRDEVPAAVMLK
jgi:hypothetical protein